MTYYTLKTSGYEIFVEGYQNATLQNIGDFFCPHCMAEFKVDFWNTEYNDPLKGKFDIVCPFCKSVFYITVNKTVSYAISR